MSAQIQEALAAAITEVHGAGIISGWVAVIEWCDTDGAFSAVTLKDENSPPWRLEGLLGAVTNFYEPDEEDED